MRLRLLSVLPAGLLGAVLLALALSGCGTQGYAPPLGKPGKATLTLSASGSATSQASATLTPFNALHVTAYYHGAQLPTTGAATPAELRQNACNGPLVAPITDGNVATTTPSPALAVYAPDPAGGMDVATASNASLFVVVWTQRNDPAATIAACGNPLSGRNQFFDLYPPTTGSSGIAVGTALITPIVATRLTFTVADASFQPVSWAVHTGSCTGATLASEQVAANTHQIEGIVFHALDLHSWWVTLTGANGATACGQVMASA
jgi:hypothetical protein